MPTELEDVCCTLRYGLTVANPDTARRVPAPREYPDSTNRYVLASHRQIDCLTIFYSGREPPGILDRTAIVVQAQPARARERPQASDQGLCANRKERLNDSGQHLRGCRGPEVYVGRRCVSRVPIAEGDSMLVTLTWPWSSISAHMKPTGCQRAKCERAMHASRQSSKVAIDHKAADHQA